MIRIKICRCVLELATVIVPILKTVELFSSPSFSVFCKTLSYVFITMWLQNLKIQCHLYKSLPLDFILNHVDPPLTVTIYLPPFHHNFSLWCSKLIFLKIFPQKSCMFFSFPPTFTAHCYLDSTILRILGKVKSAQEYGRVVV